MFLVVIDYASIVVFFGVLAGLLYLVTRQQTEQAVHEHTQAQQMAQPSARVQTISYGLLASVFVMLLLVAVLANWGSSPLRSRT